MLCKTCGGEYMKYELTKNQECDNCAQISIDDDKVISKDRIREVIDKLDCSLWDEMSSFEDWLKLHLKKELGL